ncbi:MAG: hypothetical protein XD92_1030, partial [Proteiniphilum acetatigenes]
LISKITSFRVETFSERYVIISNAETNSAVYLYIFFRKDTELL